MNMWTVWLPEHLPAQAAQLQAWQWAQQGAAQPFQGTMLELVQQRPAMVDVVVPAHLLSWHVISLPAGVRAQGDARLLPVLQHLLEDVLLEDVHTLHVALAPDAQAGQLTKVAVCQQAWLAAWLAALDQAGMKVGRVWPEVPPDIAQDSVYCTGTAHAPWCTSVRNGLPLTTPLDSGCTALHSAAVVHATPAVHAQVQQSWPQADVQLHDAAPRLAWLQRTQWNLAQHSLASSAWQRWRRKLQAVWLQVGYGAAWRGARWGAAACALVLVVGVQLQAWMGQRSLQAKQSAVVATAQQAFPRLQVVIDAPLQMQRELQALQQMAGVMTATDFEPMAAAAGQALAAVGVQANSLEYDGAQLQVTWQGPAMIDIAALQQALQGTRYRVQQSGPQALKFVMEGI